MANKTDPIRKHSNPPRDELAAMIEATGGLMVAIRTGQEPDGRWYAAVYAASEPLSKTGAYGASRDEAVRQAAGIVLEDYAQLLIDGEAELRDIDFIVVDAE